MSPLIKKIVVAGGIALVVLTIISSAIWIGLNKRYKAPSPLRCLPTTTSAVVRLADRATIVKHAREDVYGSEITDFVGGDFVWDIAARIDSLFGYADVLSQPKLKDRDLYVSYERDFTGATTRVTASFCLNNRLEWHKAMYVLGEQNEVYVRDTTIQGHDLYVLSQKGYSKPLYMAAGGGCLFASESPEVPMAFGDDNVTFMRDDASFATIERTITTKSPISIYINGSQIKNQPTNIAALDHAILTHTVRTAGTGCDWMAMDLGIHETGLTSDGFIVVLHPSLEMIMTRDQPSNIDIARRIPSAVCHFTRFAPGARGLSSEAFSEYVNNSVEVRAYRDRQSDLFRQTGVDVEALLSQVFASEVALCSYSVDGKSDKFLVVDTKGGTMAQATLTQALTALHGDVPPITIGEISPGAAAVPQRVVSSKNSDAVMVGELSIPVYDAFRDVDPLFFLNYLFGFDLPHRLFFRFEDTLVFADDMNVLRRVLVDYVLGHTMTNDARFRKMRNYFSQDCIKFSYSRPRQGSVFGAMGTQMTMAGRLPYVSICALCADDNNQEVEPSMWKLRLDSTLVGRPYAVRNHYSQQTECLAQDATGNINLIGSDGMLLWKRAISGNIVGNVSQVDFFGNGKLQYLFATDSKVYIVDRLGNDVGPFPINLPSPSTGGVRAASYADGSPIRLFVVCGNSTLLYGPDGQRVDGWSMQKSEGALSSQMGHYVCGNKDYIVFRDRFAFYFCDRRGNIRLKSEPIGPSMNSDMTVRATNSENSFVSTAADGTVISINSQDGKVNSLRVDSVGIDHIARAMGAQKIALASAKRLAIVDVNDFQVEKVVDLRLQSLDQMEVDDDVVAVLDASEHKAHIFSAKTGEEMNGSPVVAHGPIAIGKGQEGILVFSTSEIGEVVCSVVK